ncbi:MAG: hypothetical protein R3174_05710 [Gammaproteobacteria bacterium]|nr:hypothetical protein [Gammaproteobacteria bacterium]
MTDDERGQSAPPLLSEGKDSHFPDTCGFPASNLKFTNVGAIHTGQNPLIGIETDTDTAPVFRWICAAMGPGDPRLNAGMPRPAQPIQSGAARPNRP